MKKLLLVTVFALSLFVSPFFSSMAKADTEVKTLITPFIKQTVQVEKVDNNNFLYKVTPEEVDLLAHMVYGEARGESKEGKVAVAAVILNRTRDYKFPRTVKKVMFEPDAFTAVSDGQFYMNPDKTAYEAVYKALRGDDPTGGAVYYWNPKTATSGWVWSRAIIKQIGQHLFAK